jgi:hypothetical protein
MGNSGSSPHLRHTSAICIIIIIHHRGLRVPTLVLHRYRFCRLACLFLVHRITFTIISQISNMDIILLNPSRQ